MENQQENWFSKNKVMLVIFTIVAIAIVLNCNDLVMGFKDGYNAGIK